MVDAYRTEHQQVTPTVDELISDFDKLCYHQEEPFTSSSVYAQFRVFALAKQHGVRVLLDGQGADETLAGYDKYLHWYLQELVRTKPRQMLREKAAIRKNGLDLRWTWKNYLAAWFPAQAANELEKKEARRLLRQPDITDEFKQQFFDRQSIVKPLVTKLNDMLYFNSFQSGLEELLRYADRNSMAHGAEVRLPYLSHELVEFIFALPAYYKIHDGWTKWILRKAVSGCLPEATVWRTDKIGYEPPQKLWMESPRLQERIQEAKRTLVKEGILKQQVMDKKIQPHEASAADGSDWRYLVAAVGMARP